MKGEITMMTTRRNLLKGTAAGSAAVGLTLAGLNSQAQTRDSNGTVRIGFMTALSGSDAATGIEYEKGIKLAIEEINEIGGILGRPVQHYPIDTKNRSADEVVGAARRLIDKERVHAIINGHNIGSQSAEYEPIADAGIIYIHANTLIQHHEIVLSDPNRYFGCFMGDPAELFYGTAFVDMISHLRDSGQWVPINNKIGIVAGSFPYSQVVAEGIVEAAAEQGWEIGFGPETVAVPTTEWGPVVSGLRAANCAAIANTHFFAGDIAAFTKQYVANPTNSLIWMPFGGLLQAFTDIGGKDVEGVLTSTVLGLPQDKKGNDFRERIIAKFGERSSPDVACGPYDYMHHYAIAAAISGGPGESGDFDQNRKIASNLKRVSYRGVCGTSNYHPEWQTTIPFPTVEKRDPSLGIPHLYFQVQDHQGPRSLILPAPYDVSQFKTPSWFA